MAYRYVARILMRMRTRKVSYMLLMMLCCTQVLCAQFTFDGKRIFSLFRDYPHALTPEQKRIFDEKNPYWADFFRED